MHIGSSFADLSMDVQSGLTVYVVCYNPRGAVPGAMTRDTTRSVSDATVRGRLARMHSKR